MDQNQTKGLFVAEGERKESEPAEQPPSSAGRLPTTAAEPEVSARRSAAGEILAVLERMERELSQMRAAVEATARERQHQEFSPVRLIGSIVQALVIGLVLWALSDWAFGEPHGVLQTKLAFAVVLQIAALTAFVLGREVQ